jgi:hypothetical protein
MKIQAKGLKKAQAALNKMMRDLPEATEDMMLQILMGISANTMPYVPVDTSTLINSEKRRIWKSGREIHAEISYGSNGAVNPRGTPVQDYASTVHDGPQRNWQKPTASNRFLVKGVRDFIRDDLSNIIARYSSK